MEKWDTLSPRTSFQHYRGVAQAFFRRYLLQRPDSYLLRSEAWGILHGMDMASFILLQNTLEEERIYFRIENFKRMYLNLLKGFRTRKKQKCKTRKCRV